MTLCECCAARLGRESEYDNLNCVLGSTLVFGGEMNWNWAHIRKHILTFLDALASLVLSRVSGSVGQSVGDRKLKHTNSTFCKCADVQTLDFWTFGLLDF